MVMNKVIDKNYGSIPHLSTSKLTQQADKRITEGQEIILTKKARDWKDLIIVTEKIDGSNVGIIKQGGRLIPISRAGYDCHSSKYEQHRYFIKWVYQNENLFSFLPEGWRVCGEWCAQAHGTFYDITDESPFVAFDIFNDKNIRLLFIDFLQLCLLESIPMVPILHFGQPISVANALKLMGKGHYGNPEKPEGVVYRVEREGRVDFLAKWVRADKEDGKYLDQDIWNQGFNLEI
jgi:hypothetical protein